MSDSAKSIALPTGWSPAQALAAFELIDLIRDQLWAAYGPAIQQALRDDLQQPDPDQLDTSHDDGEPF